MEELQSLNWSILTPILVIALLLMLVALVDCIKAEQTNGPKWMWVLIIILINLLGPVIYFVIGRRQN